MIRQSIPSGLEPLALGVSELADGARQAGMRETRLRGSCGCDRCPYLPAMSLLNVMFGRPLATEESDSQRVGPLVGVPILGLDALGSAAYGPEALLTALLPLGVAGLAHLSLLTGAIMLLTAIVFLSYWQTIAAYPGGGGAYTVAKENLGDGAGLMAAAALGLDYILNVAVAIAAGVGALVSAVPTLQSHELLLCLGLLALLTLINLRGIRATGLAFMLPTWVFVACLLSVIAIGLGKTLASGGNPLPVVAPHVAPRTLGAASAWLLLRAFANGCTAMTGVEAVSNGVPIFREPVVVGAHRTLTLIVSILLMLVAGEAVLCRTYGITATLPGQPGFQSVLSQLTAAVVGHGVFYYLSMASVVTVLALSANTSFADFPRLCRMLAQDRWLPEPFVHRGRRLAFSHGILVLSAISAMLLIAFGGITDHLIPLFAIGALLAFTLSQAGMVAHWRKRKGARALHGLLMNALGAAATAATAGVALASKLSQGAWISIVLVLAMLLLFRQVRRHYDFVARATATSASLEGGAARPPLAVIPLRRWDAVALKAMRFSVGFAQDVVAVQVLTNDRELDHLGPRWRELAVEPARRLGLKPPELVVLRSEYRQLFAPLLEFISELERNHPDRQVAVVIPQLVEWRWYHYFLHSQTASLMKAALLFRGGPQIVIVDIPWYLKDWVPERRWLHRGRATAPPS